jgi:hypothetical protein
VDESASSLFIQSGLIDGIDESGRDDAEHLIEEARTLLGLALLKYEAASQDGNQQQADEH